MIDEVKAPGKEFFSPARSIGAAMSDFMLKHPDFYLFSPDETTSNKLDAIYEFESRAWDLPQKAWDLPEAANGRIIEMLSENTLFACMVGHLMNGESAMMTSYESFFNIITSQILQHIKFLQQSAVVSWRPNIPSANLLSTSTCWRQDHNGFTHQSPALISALLSNPSCRANCLFPLDDVAAEATFIYLTKSKNMVNLATFNKTEQPRWLNSHQADAQFASGGVAIVDFADGSEVTISGPKSPSVSANSDDSTVQVKTIKKANPHDDPDFVLVGVGDIVSCEALAALKILRQDLPELHFRFININALSYNHIGLAERPLTQKKFDEFFTADKPIIANFHGYPAVLHQILSQYTNSERLHVHGFEEQGSTTTPFQMLSVNRASRYHLTTDVAKRLNRDDLAQKYQKILADNRDYAYKHDVDLPELASY